MRRVCLVCMLDALSPAAARWAARACAAADMAGQAGGPPSAVFDRACVHVFAGCWAWTCTTLTSSCSTSRSTCRWAAAAVSDVMLAAGLHVTWRWQLSRARHGQQRTVPGYPRQPSVSATAFVRPARCVSIA